MSQGLPDGFVRTGLKTYLIAQGTSIGDIANLIALTSWPWAIKWVWGPIIDRFNQSSLGRRRPWILGAQFGMGLTMGAILLLPDLSNGLRVLGILILIINGFSSLQDVAIDALAIDILPGKERGVANGLMFGSFYVGSFMGGAVVGRYLILYGVQQAILLEIFILALIAVFALLFRERRGDNLLPGRQTIRTDDDETLANKSIGNTLSQLKAAFLRHASILAAALAICSLASTSAFSVFWPVHMVRQLHWTSESFLTLEGRYAIIAGLLGSLLGGVCASWFGAKRVTIAAIVLFSLCWLLFAATSNVWENKNVVMPLFLAVSFLAGLFQVSMFALFMGVCSPVVAATQFSAYMAMLNISSGFGAKVAGYLDERISLVTVFVGLAIFQWVMILIVSLMEDSTSNSAEELLTQPQTFMEARK